MYQNKMYADLADKYLADGCVTFSKHRSQYAYNAPVAYKSFRDGKLTGVDGKEYVDWSGGLGANNLGFGDVTSIPSAQELMFARALNNVVPFIEKMKILKTGSEACSASLRYARAYTGRKQVLGYGYHGYLNEFISEENPGAGCVYQHYTKFDGASSLASHLESVLNNVADHDVADHDIAAVIIEPVILEDTKEHKAIVKWVRSLCKMLDILFIADEIVSAFRYLRITVSQAWDLAPDLICLGKSLAGTALSVVGGRADIFNKTKGVFISTTYAGDRHALVRALDLLTSETLESDIQKAWDLGGDLKQRFNEVMGIIQLKGYNTRMTWDADPAALTAYWELMAQKGHLLGRAFFVSQYITKEYVDKFICDSTTSLGEISNGYKNQGGVIVSFFERYKGDK